MAVWGVLGSGKSSKPQRPVFSFLMTYDKKVDALHGVLKIPVPGSIKVDTHIKGEYMTGRWTVIRIGCHAADGWGRWVRPGKNPLVTLFNTTERGESLRWPIKECVLCRSDRRHMVSASSESFTSRNWWKRKQVATNTKETHLIQWTHTSHRCKSKCRCGW